MQLIITLLPHGVYTKPDSGRITPHFGGICSFCKQPSEYSVVSCAHHAKHLVCGNCMAIYTAARREFLSLNIHLVSGSYNVPISRIATLRYFATNDTLVGLPICGWCRINTPFHNVCKKEYTWLMSTAAQGATKWLLACQLLIPDIARHMLRVLIPLVALHTADLILHGTYVPPARVPEINAQDLPSIYASLPCPAAHLSIWRYVNSERLAVEYDSEANYSVFSYKSETVGQIEIYEKTRIMSVWCDEELNMTLVKVQRVYGMPRYTTRAEDYFTEKVVYRRANEIFCYICGGLLTRAGCEVCNLARLYWSTGNIAKVRSVIGCSMLIW